MKITNLIEQWDAVQIGARIEYAEFSLNYAFRRYKGKTVSGEIIHTIKPFETLSPSLLKEWYQDMTDEKARLQAISGAYRIAVKTDETDADGLPVVVILELSQDFIESGMQSIEITEKDPESMFNYMDLLRQETEARESEYFQTKQIMNGYGRMTF